MSIHVDKPRNAISVVGWLPVVGDNKLPIVYDTYSEAFEHASYVANMFDAPLLTSAEYIEEIENWNVLYEELSKYVELDSVKEK